MSSKRISQVNELIQHELSTIFLREIEFDTETLVTITRVDAAADLKTAKVFLSIFPVKKYGTALGIIKKRAPFIQSLLNKKLSMHHVPSLSYEIDTEMQYMDEVDKIFDTLKKE